LANWNFQISHKKENIIPFSRLTQKIGKKRAALRRLKSREETPKKGKVEARASTPTQPK
jgi:hypothetical protein